VEDRVDARDVLLEDRLAQALLEDRACAG